MNAEMP